jgi:hypothetical protein
MDTFSNSNILISVNMHKCFFCEQTCINLVPETCSYLYYKKRKTSFVFTNKMLTIIRWLYMCSEQNKRM